MKSADEGGDPQALLAPGEAEKIREEHFLCDLPDAVFSTLLLRQLRDLRDSRSLDTFQIADEVRQLEGVGRGRSTKPATPFKRPPLKGLWHQHFSNARFILQNIGARWNLGRGGNEALDRMISEEFAAEESGVFTDALAARIAHRITVEAYQDRAVCPGNSRPSVAVGVSASGSIGRSPGGFGFSKEAGVVLNTLARF